MITPAVASDSEPRGAADRPVLGTLLAALRSEAAQTLVTGDKDLLLLRERHAMALLREQALIGDRR